MTKRDIRSFPPGGCCAVIGASGGIGAAIADLAEGSGAFGRVLRLSRSGDTPVDVTDEASVAAAADRIARVAATMPLRLVFDATGFLHDAGRGPEKSWRHIDPAAMAHAFAVNAIGPALLVKHLLPLLPRQGRAVFATLSARVGGIADNRLGGWYSYRASKAALNQIVRTAAIELARHRPEAIAVALHPGTVDTSLSRPFSRNGLVVRTPVQAAGMLLAVVDGLAPDRSGGFLDYSGASLPW